MDSHAIISGVAQWLACWAHNPKVRGSKPRSATFIGLRKHSNCQIYSAAQQRRFDWIKTGRAVKAVPVLRCKLAVAERASWDP